MQPQDWEYSGVRGNLAKGPRPRVGNVDGSGASPKGEEPAPWLGVWRDQGTHRREWLQPQSEECGGGKASLKGGNAASE